MTNTSLTRLADRYGSDKGRLTQPYHGYTFIYENLFSGIRNRPLEILELGLAKTTEDERGKSERRTCLASPSVSIWLDYFPRSHVTGFDLSDFSGADAGNDRFTFIQGDLGNAEDYRKIADSGKRFDIIIDDGSHATLHQMLAFLELFPLLNDGGFYIVEDLWSQPETIERQYPVSSKFHELFRTFDQTGFFPDIEPEFLNRFNNYTGQIGSLMFFPYHNLSGKDDQLLIISKSIDSDYSRYRSKIRFFKQEIKHDDEASLNRHTELFPENPYPWFHLGLLYLGSGNHARALEYIEKSHALEANDPDIMVYKIYLLFLNDRSTEARDFAFTTIDSGSVHADYVILEAANKLVRKSGFDLARNLLEHNFDSNCNSSKYHYLIALCYEFEENYGQALEHMKIALGSLPDKKMYIKADVRIREKILLKDIMSRIDNALYFRIRKTTLGRAAVRFLPKNLLFFLFREPDR